MDRASDGDVLRRVRLAWLSALTAYVRAAKRHDETAALQTQNGHPELARRASKRAAEERAGYDAALARHPEWAEHAPPWRKVGV